MSATSCRIAFEDWFRRKEQHVTVKQHAVLLVDDSPFFRDMLTPVLQAAGYEVTAVGSASEALAMLNGGRHFDVDRHRHRDAGDERLRIRRGAARRSEHAAMPVIALSSVVSAEAVERGREVGFHDYVAKFDRQGLIAALKEQIAVGRAA